MTLLFYNSKKWLHITGNFIVKFPARFCLPFIPLYLNWLKYLYKKYKKIYVDLFLLSMIGRRRAPLFSVCSRRCRSWENVTSRAVVFIRFPVDTKNLFSPLTNCVLFILVSFTFIPHSLPCMHVGLNKGKFWIIVKFVIVGPIIGEVARNKVTDT